MFARINHELAEREVLEQQRQGLLKKKQGLIADNKKRKDDLASLDRELEGFIDVSSLIFSSWDFEGAMVEECAYDVCVGLGCETDTEDLREAVLRCSWLCI